MSEPAPRDVVGALGGSRLFEQPRWAHEAAAWRVFVAPGPPVLVEIGFDHGRRLTHTAKHHPGWRVAGLEIRRRRVDANPASPRAIAALGAGTISKEIR